MPYSRVSRNTMRSVVPLSILKKLHVQMKSAIYVYRPQKAYKVQAKASQPRT